MTLKTVTGPSTRDALAEARRLFGADVVLLQSAPAAHGAAASVTVAFDTVPSPDRDVTAPLPNAAWTVEPARPEPGAPPAARAYGYANVRKAPAPAAEPISAPRRASVAAATASSTRPAPTANALRFSNELASPTMSPLRPGEGQGEGSETYELATSGSTPRVASPSIASPPRASAPLPAEPTASASEVAALRARLAELETVIAEVRAAAPPAVLRRAPLVLVGPGGSGKTSLALRLAQSPELANAQRPAVLLIAPDADRFVDPASVFWGAGVPVAVARTPDDVADAVETFADADLLIVDTPSLPLSATRARPVVRRLGDLLAPLGTVEVVFVLDATRAQSTLDADALPALGLQPDALALTRLDEAPDDARSWAEHLGLAIRVTSSGPDLGDLSDTPAAPDRASPAFAVAPAARAPRELADPFAVEPIPASFSHVPVLA